MKRKFLMLKMHEGEKTPTFRSFTSASSMEAVTQHFFPAVRDAMLSGDSYYIALIPGNPDCNGRFDPSKPFISWSAEEATPEDEFFLKGNECEYLDILYTFYDDDDTHTYKHPFDGFDLTVVDWVEEAIKEYLKGQGVFGVDDQMLKDISLCGKYDGYDCQMVVSTFTLQAQKGGSI